MTQGAIARLLNLSFRPSIPVSRTIRRIPQLRFTHPIPSGTMSHAHDLIESAKRAAGHQAVAEHFQSTFTHVGIGSGSTIKYVVDAIAENLATQGNSKSKIAFVPTGYQSRQVILAAGLTPLLFDQLPDDVVLDVAFDGADEVDDDLNCIKGGGACLFQEKLVAQRAKKFVCVAGTSSCPFFRSIASSR
jgi:ribose 5-phosphate isomerase